MPRSRSWAWCREVEQEDWDTPAKVEEKYRSATIVADNRGVFNIKGDSYLGVVRVNDGARIVFIRFVGTHAEYDPGRRGGGVSMGKIKAIRSEADYNAALARIDALMDAEPDTPEGDELDVLADLVEHYEEKHVPMGFPSPVAAIEFRLEQAGLPPRDLIPFIGSRAKEWDRFAIKPMAKVGWIQTVRNLSARSEGLVRDRVAAVRDIQRTGELMAGWEMRFRLPEIAEIGSVLANIQKSPWSEAIMAAMPQTSRLADALGPAVARGVQHSHAAGPDGRGGRTRDRVPDGVGIRTCPGTSGDRSTPVATRSHRFHTTEKTC